MMTPILLALASAATMYVAADTTTYAVLNHGRPAGDMKVVRSGDSVVVSYRHVDRNRGRWVVNRYRVGPNGTVIAGESRPSSRTGEVGEPSDWYEVAGDSIRWRGRGARGAAPLSRGGFYALAGGTAFDAALLANHLLKQPGRTGLILPSGTGRAEIVADTVVTTLQSRQRVRLVMVHGQQGITPSAVWLDDRGELFASAVGWFITVRPGAEATLPALRSIEIAYRDRQGAELARRITPAASGTVVIRNGDVFDSERGVMMPRTTVVIEGDRIVSVGPAASVSTPRGARVIDATGKSVVPGLWDMHTHFQLTSQTGGVVRQLAGGITTIRDLAADTDVAVSHRDRANSGALVAPRVLLGGFIEGPGLWAGPSDVLVRTEDEAREWVARYDSLGYRQIKLYNIVHPDLVPAIAEETRRRGMRLSGHVPRGLSVPAAVRLGLDEINHAAFLFSTFYQDSLYVPEMRPYSGVAAIVAPNVNVDGPEMTALIADLAAHGTVIDGTFNLWMRDTSGADAERGRAGNANYLRLIKRLHEGGVTIVPGTDGSSYNQELENYERAGIPAAEVLRLATIVSARVMKEDADYGSIAPGKVADIVIVDGRPAERIADLRRVDMVFRAGRGYEPNALMEAIGMRLAARRADR